MNDQLRDITRVRLRFIDLIKSFFFEMPDAERLARWRGIFHALHNERVAPLLDHGIERIRQRLAENRLSDLQQEYTELFGNNAARLSLRASHYLDGRTYDDTTAALHQFIRGAALQRHSLLTEPDDTLVVLFDMLATLVHHEKNGQSTRHLQAGLVHEFLQPFIEELGTAADRHSRAWFYHDCILFTGGYLELERRLLS